MSDRRHPYFDHATPLNIAHRGGGHLAPENTLAAFANSLALGAEAIELDVHLTRDGEIVVLHDSFVNRTTNGAGSVARLSLAELRLLDAGYRFRPDRGRTYPMRGQGSQIPMLREVLERFPQTRINIGVKAGDSTLATGVLALIQEYHAADRVLFGCASRAPLAYLRAAGAGTIATAASADEFSAYLLREWLRRPQAKPAFAALQVPEALGGVRLVTRRTIAAAHEIGLDVHIWTVNDRADMERLLAWGVDGIMTDRPDILADVLRERHS